MSLSFLFLVLLFFSISHSATSPPNQRAQVPRQTSPPKSYLLPSTTPRRHARSLLASNEGSVFETLHSGDLLASFSYVFATIACTDEMEAGISVLHESLLASGHREPLLVITGPSMSTHVRARMARMPLIRIFRTSSGYKGFCKTSKSTKTAHISDCAHLKIMLFSLDNVKKVVFLEYDTIVMRPLTELVQLPPFSAVREPHVADFETAVMVLVPDPQVYGLLRKDFCNDVNHDRNTSDHRALRKIVPKDAWTEASDTYNVPQQHMDVMWYRSVEKRPAIIHYKGATKPWNWWRLGRGEPISTDAFNRWCKFAATTRFACGAPEWGDAMKPPMKPTSWSSKNKITVILSTFHRPTWVELLRLYVSFKTVSRVVLVWHDPFGDPPSASTLGPKVVVWQPKRDSLNNRFFAPGNLEDCVYIADDDMQVTESQLKQGFRAWKSHTRRLVGFFPRRWTMDSPYYSTRVHDGYNIVLTKGLFTHRYFLYMYVHLLPARIKEVVNEFSNCEDILFNMMVSGYNGLAPMHVLVEGSIVDLGRDGGISSSGSHYATRYKCVHALIHEMGLKKAPLSPGSYSEKPLKNKEKR